MLAITVSYSTWMAAVSPPSPASRLLQVRGAHPPLCPDMQAPACWRSPFHIQHGWWLFHRHRQQAGSYGTRYASTVMPRHDLVGAGLLAITVSHSTWMAAVSAPSPASRLLQVRGAHPPLCPDLQAPACWRSSFHIQHGWRLFQRHRQQAGSCRYAVRIRLYALTCRRRLAGDHRFIFNMDGGCFTAIASKPAPTVRGTHPQSCPDITL
ncbi:hypothetical protein SAMN04490194_5035 [Pseudomonas migulae]|uniref:Uncharacterized protein n=1 Tax=Pseudomonas migulae TaxID=78543 RepID=A0A1H5MRQ5_9PSED|nr:hypothetical protein SAMN04490194_5035 [Pseudomonas migulae]